MLAYKTYITIDDARQAVLSNLPFEQGQRVEVVLIADENPSKLAAKAKDLFKQTQALPQVKSISEAEILEEINNYRKERNENNR